MYYAYILRSETTGKYYIGSTNNLDRRLKEHNGNQTTSLKNKGPFVIIYKETFATLRLARKRESEIKSYKGGNAFKKLIKTFKQ
jgi:putative endonuclease